MCAQTAHSLGMARIEAVGKACLEILVHGRILLARSIAGKHTVGSICDYMLQCRNSLAVLSHLF